jgi:hypothetical protein
METMSVVVMVAYLVEHLDRVWVYAMDVVKVVLLVERKDGCKVLLLVDRKVSY